jgi:carboxymethylenebutenolidase
VCEVWSEASLLPFQACLALPRSASQAGVLVLHSWWGLTSFFRSLCEGLARAGFVACAPDLYGGYVAATAEEAQSLRLNLPDELARLRIDTALDAVHSHMPPDGRGIGVIGCSLGGYLALDLARRRPDAVRALVVFYATTGGDFSGAKAAVLGHFAATNGCWASGRTVASLRRRLLLAGCRVTFHEYAGAEHCFFERDCGEAYSPEQADLAWRRTLRFLRRELGVRREEDRGYRHRRRRPLTAGVRGG